MKKLTKVLSIVVFSILTLTVVTKADHISSYNAQQEFRAKVLDLLKANDLEQLEEYFNSIPDCEYSEDGTVPPLCTFDRIDGKDFVVHSYQRAFKTERKDFTSVNMDGALYARGKQAHLIREPAPHAALRERGEGQSFMRGGVLERK